MDFLKVDRQPDLHDPVAVVAFAGWNDAASAATNAARFVVRRLGARKFATIDPEPFIDFRETRPSVRINSRNEREISWPTNDFFYARNPTGPHDIVVAVGIEPNLRWGPFAEAYAGLFRKMNVKLAVSLGALMAEVPHTRAVRVTGSAFDPAVANDLDLSVSNYEGPTGIVGVLHQTLRQRKLPAASLWANVPHYITTTQNPPATIALLRRLQKILAIEFDYSELDAAGSRFLQEINTAISGNSDLLEYVRRLETAVDSGGDPGATEGAALPPAEDLVLDVEAFLRNQRDDD
ncbi:MAG: PAC2 family protein [Anaerolineaceae bacterium]